MSAAGSLLEACAWSCSACGRTDFAAARPRHCGLCGRFNSYRAAPAVERAAVVSRSNGTAAARASWQSASEAARGSSPVRRLRGACRSWDAVTGGLAFGFCYLVGARRGAGKTRYLLRTLSDLAFVHGQPLRVLSSEQSAGQLALTLDEVGAPPLAELCDTGEVAELPEAGGLVLVDSLRAATWRGEPCTGGSSAERAAIRHCLHVARAGAAVVLVQHVDEASGAFMGGQLVASLVDVVLTIRRATEGPGYVLGCEGKNRCGPDDQTAPLARHNTEGGRLCST